jgi:hypothetical protein
MTIAELKERMGQDELGLWEAYVTENGPLNLPLRLESAVARAVSPFLKNTKPRDLMPWPKEPEPEATPEKLLLMFKGCATASKQRKH